jgi:hypothetical protein
MTARDAPQRQHPASGEPMPFDRLDGVHRTRGLVATAPGQEGRDNPPVRGDDKDDAAGRRAHWTAPARISASLSCATNVWKFVVALRCVAATITSQPRTPVR